jgi:hypothetical protein
MTAAVCTLYEGDFHFGVGALVNSLYTVGFRGNVWVGYRGPLPRWARPLVQGEGCSSFEVAPNCTIHFVPVETPRHLTNYKATFMRRVIQTLAPDCEQVFYFDPDIIIRFPWAFFSDWASDSVALSEDVNSPLHDTHPKRNSWRRFFAGEGIIFRNPLHIYTNGGFVALPRTLTRFLVEWDHIMEIMHAKGLSLESMHFGDDYRTWIVDQDALNVSAMATECPLSLCGKEGMGFILSASPMLHQIGKKKPRHQEFQKNVLGAYAPARSQRAFWDHVESPIRLYPATVVRRHRTENLIAAFAARFYRR